MPLAAPFYQSDDVEMVAKSLLGCILHTFCPKQGLTSGCIVETEAYGGAEDRACHAFGNRRTPRTRVMYQAGGVAYVYLCYGLHPLLNIVTGPEGVPHAVLIRAIEPAAGRDAMLRRLGRPLWTPSLTAGPGRTCKALGIHMEHNAASLLSDRIWIERGPLNEREIRSSLRIGVDFAGIDALRPWRFTLEPSPCTSKRQAKKGIRL